MKLSQLFQILKKPLLSEKAAQLQQNKNVATLSVHPKANKYGIKCAVERLFGVKVSQVRVLTVKSKLKRKAIRRGLVKQVESQSYKKAYVTLAQGSQLNFIEPAGISGGS